MAAGSAGSSDRHSSLYSVSASGDESWRSPHRSRESPDVFPKELGISGRFSTPLCSPVEKKLFSDYRSKVSKSGEREGKDGFRLKEEGRTEPEISLTRAVTV